MLVVATDRHALHRPETEFVEGDVVPAYEIPARADDILGAVAEAHEVRPPAEHGTERLQRVHDAGYLRHLQTAWGQVARRGRERPARRGHLPAWAPILRGWAAADCALAAADAVAAGTPAAYALCRPPGHHAGRDFSGGYCYLNNAAIAAASLGQSGARVAILDLDYHHGNGTQQIFWEEPAVLYVSLHADTDYEYPYYSGRASERGGGAAEGSTINLPLPFATADEAYLRAAREACERIESWGAEALVVSLGLDAFDGDPMGRFSLGVEAFGRLGALAKALGLPTVAVQEGGYAVGLLGSLVLAFLGALGAADPRTASG